MWNAYTIFIAKVLKSVILFELGLPGSELLAEKSVTGILNNYNLFIFLLTNRNDQSSNRPFVKKKTATKNSMLAEWSVHKFAR